MIGVFGGTFDPVHQGHVEIARGLLKEIPLKEIRFIPCRAPVHKPDALASADDRVAMLKIALKNQHQCLIDAREILRDSPSYMVETLDSLRTETADNLALILGMDAFLGFSTWHQFEKILTLAHLIVVGRKQYALPTSGVLAKLIQRHQILNPADFQKRKAGYIYFSKLPTPPISSTAIRDFLKRGMDVPENLMSRAVLTYIQKKELY